MTKRKRKIMITLIALIIITALIVSVWTILYFKSFARDDFKLGVHFSKSYAQYLGLDWKKAYLAILDDLKVENIRLAAPWNEIEPARGQLDFFDLDWQVQRAAERGVNVILIVGRRTPHWPECHDPDWIKVLPAEIVVDRQLEMMEQVILRYKKYDNIKIWQVENEPLLNVFGECPPGDLDLLRKEAALVKSIDPRRPILVTDSGELSLWQAAARSGDLFGTTLYRVIRNNFSGYFYYHLPPAFYNLKARLAGRLPGEVIISELQAEPWAAGGILNIPIAEQAKSMDAERLVNHVKYARRTGFSGAYLWGAEWWYWLKETQGDATLWTVARQLF